MGTTLLPVHGRGCSHCAEAGIQKKTENLYSVFLSYVLPSEQTYCSGGMLLSQLVMLVFEYRITPSANEQK